MTLAIVRYVRLCCFSRKLVLSFPLMVIVLSYTFWHHFPECTSVAVAENCRGRGKKWEEERA